MKKVLTLLAVFTAIGIVACKPVEPEPDPVVATITANDVTVEEGNFALIGATTNSSAAITYESDNTAVATVTAAGEVAGVSAGTANITLKVAEVAGKFTAAEKTIKVTVTPKEEVPPTPTGITVDGDFSDWSALEAGTFAKAVCDPNAPWESVEEIRCYASGDKVYWYIKFDKYSLDEVADWDTKDSHIRLCINTDDEFESGYTSYFLEGYDFIIEGSIISEGAFVEFDGTLHQRISGKWTSLLEPENGLVYGIGNGTEYEIWMDRTLFNEAAGASSVPMPMGDHFQTGIRFYCNGWDEWSNMPNCDVDEEAGNGYGYLMRVKFN